MKLGVIGGLGPIATAYFFELIVKMTEAACDQEHLEMIIYNCPSIPDRTKYILGETKESPLKPMIEIGNQLAQQGVDYIAIPCITAHCFHDQLQQAIPCNIIHVIKEILEYVKMHQISCVGIMATDGTVATELFQSILEAGGVRCIVPDQKHQGWVMDLIYQNVKSGKPVNMEKFKKVSEHLWYQGAQVNILGCTELSLIKRDYPIGEGYLDAMEILARASILKCQGKLKLKDQLFIKEGVYYAK